MEFSLKLPTRVVSGAGSLDRLGGIARTLGFTRTLLVADGGMVASGYSARAARLLEDMGIAVAAFHDIEVNPDGAVIERGRAFAAPFGVDSVVALGGGSSLDTAKAINFVLSNGGSIRDYRGYGRSAERGGHAMLPMIGIPTTAGTGSEAQSYAVISDPETHMKMACGDPGAAFRVAILDASLLVSTPRAVAAQAGYDALSHAVESFVTTKHTPLSQSFSREAWRLLNANYERVLTHPEDVEAQGHMQVGAFLAGLAIEHSMLGATHACANPLSAHYGTVHGVAIAMLLGCVVRWNDPAIYRGLHPHMDVRVTELSQAGALPQRLRDAGVSQADLQRLSDEAAQQWTGTFNPRKLDARGALEIYECAY